MHAVFVSSCERKALTRTRSLLDRYSQRIGDRAWATRITQHGLDEIWRALKKQATHQSCIACYRSDTTLGLRLMWVVGNRAAYDSRGLFAVATRARKPVYPLVLRHAALVARAAGLTHDFGKASRKFQTKLSNARLTQPDYIRHEWVSAWLLNTLVGQEEESAFRMIGFDAAWASLSKDIGRSTGALQDERLRSLMVAPNVIDSAQSAVLWSVVTHHGATGGSIERPNGANSTRHIRDVVDLDNLTFAGFGKVKEDLARWDEVLRSTESTLKRLSKAQRTGMYWDGVMLMARAAMILADHKVSSEVYPHEATERVCDLYANTKRKTETVKQRGKKPKTVEGFRRDQPLSWHLQQVGEQAAKNIRMFSDHGLAYLDERVRDHLLHDGAQDDPRFAWQYHASNHLETLRDSGPHLIFNVAGTGAGKTVANLKMALTLRENARITVALNLRSLTTQTFDAYRQRLAALGRDVFEENFACVMGQRGEVKTDQGEEDADGDAFVLGNVYEVLDYRPSRRQAPAWLGDIAKRSAYADKQLENLLVSPALICTTDWIVSAGEPGRQDRHATAMIRLSNSDLILDEIDSYDIQALVAVLRLVKTSAMFGRNVIVSSATLNPVLGGAVVQAYQAGKTIHAAMYGSEAWSISFVSDMIDPEVHQAAPCKDISSVYKAYMRRASKVLEARPVTKRFEITPMGSDTGFTASIAQSAHALHMQHVRPCPGLQCRVSIGLVRVANVGTCLGVSNALLQDGRFHVCAYHARELASRRAEKERFLDRILNRQDDGWVDALIESAPWLREHTDDVCFVVVATPVEEVGRDHDFDWAVIEPSSAHSIIQTAGRVNRHRRQPLPADSYNVAILDKNARAVGYPKRSKDRRVFVWPGFEFDGSHTSHTMTDMLQPDLGLPNTILDARMIFDEDGLKTRFAHCDETAIQTMLNDAMNVITQREGYETAYMIERFAADYPLRSGAAQTLILDWTSQQGKAFYTLGRNEAGQTKPAHWSAPPEGIARAWLTWNQCETQQLAAHVDDSIAWPSSADIPCAIRILWNGVTDFNA